MNKFGHVEIWKGKIKDAYSRSSDEIGESDAQIYLQADYDVKAFFDLIGKEYEAIESGDWEYAVDPGYF